MAVENFVLELAIVISIAVALALLGKMVRQPTIIAYLLTGILIGPLFFNVLKSPDLIKIFAHLGVTFLLFFIGLNLDFRIFKEIRKTAFIVSLGQVLLTSSIAFIIAFWLGFSYLPAFFLAIALAFSSTIVVMKMLSEKKELDTLHGRIIVGIIVMQNLIAALVLMLVPIIGTGLTSIGEQFFKGIFLILIVFLISRLVIPGVLFLAAKSQEILLLFSIGWALLVAAVFYISGFSIEIGALIAGISLASSQFSLDIRSKMKGIREFFVMVHLIFFGSLLIGPITSELILTAGIFSIFILIGNPIIVMSIMKGLGYKKQTGFFTGISISQISEFSLIIVFVSYVLGILPRETLSLVVLIALITIGVSSYEIQHSRRIYKIFSPILGIFDSKGRKEPGLAKVKNYKIILFGYNRIGFNLLKSFNKIGKDYVIVDFNPNTISDLSSRGVNCIYGDAEDPELLKKLKLNEAEIIISTIPELETNLTLRKNITNKDVIFIPTAHSISDAKKIYDAGADYVIMPHFLGGEFVANMLAGKKFTRNTLKKEKWRHLSDLAERIIEGHEHPSRDNYGK